MVLIKLLILVFKSCYSIVFEINVPAATLFQWNQYVTMASMLALFPRTELTTLITKISLDFFCCLQYSFCYLYRYQKWKKRGKVLIAFCTVGKEVQTAKRSFPDILLGNWPPTTAVLLKVFPPAPVESKKQDSRMDISSYNKHSIISAASER